MTRADGKPQTPTLLIRGDFNCPFSAIASDRAARLQAAGLVHVDWQAVEHDPDIPPAGEAIEGDLAVALRAELAQIDEHLVGAEHDLLTMPSRRPNTHRAVLAYAGVAPTDRDAVRRQIFGAYWQDNADIGDASELERLGACGSDATIAAAWRDAWLVDSGSLVPVMLLPDGYLSRGLGVLTRLGEALAGDTDRIINERPLS